MDSSQSYFSSGELGKIFSFESSTSDRLISRENSRLEFKETFNLGSADDYAKTAAAFANARGGYIVFGVKDSPRQLVGLNSRNFETLDPAKLTNALNERFSPEIHWAQHTCIERELKLGIFYFEEAKQKPVICTRNGGCLQQGAIYYRYRGRSETIRYSELRGLLDEQVARERNVWMKQLRKISEAGIENVAVLNLQSGEVSGSNGKFFVSEELLAKIQFVREGEFVETEGALALRLIGDVQSVEGPVIHSTLPIPTQIHESELIAAFLRRESVLSPTEYLKAICFEQSYFLPVYFFIQQTNVTIGEIVTILEALEVRGVVRNKLVERLKRSSENLAIGSLTGSGVPSTERKLILDQLRERTLQPGMIVGQKVRFFEALTHTDAIAFDKDCFSRYLLNMSCLLFLNSAHHTVQLSARHYAT